jgi:polyisoprenoid-binding protein YceI
MTTHDSQTTGPTETTAPSALPIGTWRVDPTAGELAFRARGMFGLATVKGTFSDYEGELTVDPDGARGELRISATTLNTGNARRDAHLRSADFFDVEHHPTVTFTLTSVHVDTSDRLLGTGDLKIAENSLEITSPITATTDADHLHLDTEISVDRAAAGVGWSKLGMIQGQAHLRARVVLVRQA